MIKWYDDNKTVAILFNIIPCVAIRYILPSSTEAQKKSIKKYPFINKKDLHVRLWDYKKLKQYEFVIPKGYCYDGASIPKFFHRIIGANTDNSFMIAALIHDVLCENHKYVNNDREFSSDVFMCLLIQGGVSKAKARVMRNAVDLFQRTQHWG